MSESPNLFIQILTIITGFLSDNFIYIILLVLLLNCKDAISNFISRMTSIHYKRGDDHIGIDVATPSENRDIRPELKDATEKPELIEENSKIEDKAKDENWFFQMDAAFNEGRLDDAEAAFKKYSIEEKDEVLLEKNRGLYLYFKFIRGKDNGALAELELHARSAKTELSKFDILQWLSFCYGESMQNLRAIDMWKTVVSETKDEYLKTKAVTSLAIALNKEGESIESKKIILERLSFVKTDEQKCILYEALSTVELSLGEKSISVYCKDKSIEYNPNNRSELFNSAYSASNEDINEISIGNYVKLLRIDSGNSTALNNLGVQAQEAGFKIKAVENYKKSENHKNTLALSNQGYLLLGAGFAQDAEELAKKAIELGDVHQNIYKLISAINEKKEMENKEWEKLVDRAILRQKIIRKYTDQYYFGNAGDLEGAWFSKNIYQITIDITDGYIKSIWVEEGDAGDSYSVALTGKVSGSTFSGTHTRSKVKNDNTQLLLGYAGTSITFCIGYISDDRKSLNIIAQKFKDTFSLILSRSKS